MKKITVQEDTHVHRYRDNSCTVCKKMMPNTKLTTTKGTNIHELDKKILKEQLDALGIIEHRSGSVSGLSYAYDILN